MHFLGDESIDRRSLHGLRRRHSARCAADKCITPSCTRSQWNLPSSKRLQSRQRPVPSQKTSFTLSARFERKQ